VQRRQGHHHLGQPGERWFCQTDPIWRVHTNAARFVAGIRALLLQSLRTLAVAGIAGRCGHKANPWGRLQPTSTFLATTTFGTAEDAEALIERIRGIRQRVRGRAHDGRRYAANAPHLVKWVHIAETNGFLVAYQRSDGTPSHPPERTAT